jgi:hypothetical protein
MISARNSFTLFLLGQSGWIYAQLSGPLLLGHTFSANGNKLFSLSVFPALWHNNMGVEQHDPVHCPFDISCDSGKAIESRKLITLSR